MVMGLKKLTISDDDLRYSLDRGNYFNVVPDVYNVYCIRDPINISKETVSSIRD